MNYIVLEGFSLYLFLILVLLLVMISLSCILIAVLADRRNYILKELLDKETYKNKHLSRVNLGLKLKCGELNIDDKENI